MYMYKEDLALNNLQWLICHKTKPILIIDAQFYDIKYLFLFNNNNNLFAHSYLVLKKSCPI